MYPHITWLYYSFLLVNHRGIVMIFYSSDILEFNDYSLEKRIWSELAKLFLMQVDKRINVKSLLKQDREAFYSFIMSIFKLTIRDENWHVTNVSSMSLDMDLFYYPRIGRMLLLNSTLLLTNCVIYKHKTDIFP